MTEKPKKSRYRPEPTSEEKATAAPVLDYRPSEPKGFRPGIGLIGCGGITDEHLTAYRNAGYRVLALCDTDPVRAEGRRKRFFPAADVDTDYHELLARSDIEIADITTHPAERLAIIEDALAAGKHVLSQKPFVLDLDAGEQLVRLAEEKELRLAVNQNGRWAPHFSYLRSAVKNGLLGELASAHFRVHWDHGWVQGTPFEEVRHLILYDFAIHWFDMLSCIMGNRHPRSVFASTAQSTTQQVSPHLLAQAVIEYDGAQASLVFDADTRFGALDETFVTGSKGTFLSTGEDFKHQAVTLTTNNGVARPQLDGKWFPDGFHGTMGELLWAIFDGREPSNSAKNNLRSLALCFAAVASSETGKPVVPGDVRRLPGA